MSMEDPKPETTGDDAHIRPAGRRRYRAVAAAAGIAVALAVGAGAGAVAMNVMHPRDQQTLLPAVPVAKMTDDSLVAIKGQVAEIFGNKFVMADQSGRALVDTGPSGEGTALVKQGEEVTAQGRFDHGFVHASLVAHADGKVDELRMPPPHGPGPHGPGPHGPRDLGGPGPAPAAGPGPGPDAPRP